MGMQFDAIRHTPYATRHTPHTACREVVLSSPADPRLCSNLEAATYANHLEQKEEGKKGKKENSISEGSTKVFRRRCMQSWT